MAFLYASYANDANKQRSTTGFVFTYCGGAIAYKSRTQSITTISSTKAEFLVVVLFAKIALFFMFYTWRKRMGLYWADKHSWCY